MTNAKVPESGNTGLLYDKYCNQWCRDPEKTGPAKWSLEAFKDGNPKFEWISKIAEKTIGSETLLREAVDRQASLLCTYAQTPFFFETDWHFVTGLGREHPIENGFAWHHNLGVPYLPGSSIKGMVRAWAEYWLDPKPAESGLFQIFGPRGNAARKSPASGSVIFLDAIPTNPVTLKADIMTPHYAPYYEHPSHNPPADWYSPTPIPFLVVAPGTTFQFGLLPRRCDDNADVEKAREWLARALEVIGAGAKTAVGYGRMKLDIAAENKYQKVQQAKEQLRQLEMEQAQDRLMTPDQRRIKELRKLFVNPATQSDDERKQQLLACTAQLLKDAQKWKTHDDRLAAANLIETIYEDFNRAKDSTKKQESRQAAIAKLRQLNPE
ncbi:MAG: type III-B CRISPR module RAMP protein Cmr6 [Methylococcales bacterium]